MRDLSQWKDKVELSLDGRQLFFLFFGGAVMACLLFTLGVMTGRRLEARAIALETPNSDDPLAVLDQLGDLEDEELTYHQALTKDARAGRTRDTAPVENEAHGKPAPAKPAAPASAPKPAAPAARPPGAPKPAAHAAVAGDAEEAPVAIPPAAEPAMKSETKTEVRAQEGTAIAVKELPRPSAKDAAVTPAHFTLQLSAFAAKRDADDFVRRVQAAGYRPFVVSGDVPGKGTMYRVRIGDYASKDVALTEKTTVEKKLKVVAYLARL